MSSGRIAPTPTGLLHLGHAATFWEAHRRARSTGATVILRIEDLDPARCKAEFARACIEDLRWLGLDWDEGPDVGGRNAPYQQSRRRDLYLAAWKSLLGTGHLFPCDRSRKDVAAAGHAPHEDRGGEPIYPPEWRPPPGLPCPADRPGSTNWRFRVPDGETVRFTDGRHGEVRFTAGRDFGDFVVWNRDDVPAYELAVVVDDAAMGITEVVRGEDLLLSTARQILVFRALGLAPPAYFHCPLVRDARGRRLAKRDAALSIRALRTAGASPQDVLRLAETSR